MPPGTGPKMTILAAYLRLSPTSYAAESIMLTECSKCHMVGCTEVHQATAEHCCFCRGASKPDMCEMCRAGFRQAYASVHPRVLKALEPSPRIDWRVQYELYGSSDEECMLNLANMYKDFHDYVLGTLGIKTIGELTDDPSTFGGDTASDLLVDFFMNEEKKLRPGHGYIVLNAGDQDQGHWFIIEAQHGKLPESPKKFSAIHPRVKRALNLDRVSLQELQAGDLVEDIRVGPEQKFLWETRDYHDMRFGLVIKIDAIGPHVKWGTSPENARNPKPWISSMCLGNKGYGDMHVFRIIERNVPTESRSALHPAVLRKLKPPTAKCKCGNTPVYACASCHRPFCADCEPGSLWYCNSCGSPVCDTCYENKHLTLSPCDICKRYFGDWCGCLDKELILCECDTCLKTGGGQTLCERCYTEHAKSYASPLHPRVMDALRSKPKPHLPITWTRNTKRAARCWTGPPCPDCERGGLDTVAQSEYPLCSGTHLIYRCDKCNAHFYGRYTDGHFDVHGPYIPEPVSAAFDALDALGVINVLRACGTSETEIHYNRGNFWEDLPPLLQETLIEGWNQDLWGRESSYASPLHPRIIAALTPNRTNDEIIRAFDALNIPETKIVLRACGVSEDEITNLCYPFWTEIPPHIQELLIKGCNRRLWEPKSYASLHPAIMRALRGDVGKTVSYRDLRPGDLVQDTGIEMPLYAVVTQINSENRVVGVWATNPGLAVSRFIGYKFQERESPSSESFGDAVFKILRRGLTRPPKKYAALHPAFLEKLRPLQFTTWEHVRIGDLVEVACEEIDPRLLTTWTRADGKIHAYGVVTHIGPWRSQTDKTAIWALWTPDEDVAKDDLRKSVTEDELRPGPGFWGDRYQNIKYRIIKRPPEKYATIHPRLERAIGLLPKPSIYHVPLKKEYLPASGTGRYLHVIGQIPIEAESEEQALEIVTGMLDRKQGYPGILQTDDPRIEWEQEIDNDIWDYEDFSFDIDEERDVERS